MQYDKLFGNISPNNIGSAFEFFKEKPDPDKFGYPTQDVPGLVLCVSVYGSYFEQLVSNRQKYV